MLEQYQLLHVKRVELVDIQFLEITLVVLEEEKHESDMVLAEEAELGLPSDLVPLVVLLMRVVFLRQVVLAQDQEVQLMMTAMVEQAVLEPQVLVEPLEVQTEKEKKDMSMVILI